MRDYEELIKQLRECGSRRNCLDCPYDNDASYCIEPRITEAADAIEELILTAESYKRSMEAWADEAANAQPRWIPVTDRLPDEEEAVLAFCTNTGTVKVAWLIEGVWWTWDFYGFHISHWMPLPEPPKEVGEDA